MRSNKTFIFSSLVLAAAIVSIGYAAPSKSEAKSGKCAKDVDCEGNQVCVEGECAAPDSGKEKPKRGCEANGDCKGGRICVDGICQDPPQTPAEIAACTKDTDCKADRICVKGVCMAPSAKAKKEDVVTERNDEVKQPGTELYWLRCPLGQAWNGLACGGRADRSIRWEVAVNACPDGFRLPTRKELIDVLGGCRPGVAEGLRGYCAACGRSGTCFAMFGRDRLMYWSATASATDPGIAWRVNFSDGGVGGDSMRAGRAVRCVRGE